MLSHPSRWTLLLWITTNVQTSVAQRFSDWCSPISMKCDNTGEVLKDLSCGWCRSWTFASNIANNKLRMIGVDGGALAGDGNGTHDYMVELSLDKEVDLSDGDNWKLSLLPVGVPKLKGSTLWSDASNSTIFNYGGRSPGENIPNGIDMPTLDTKTDQWSVATALISIQRLVEGASVNAPDINRAFYIGGYQSNMTSTTAPDDGLPHYTTSMFQFNTKTKEPKQLNAPPFLPVRFGSASYIPVGSGALIYFGGESPPSADPGEDADFKVNAWDHVWVYDIKGDKWYKQDTTGTATPRSEFCASTLYDDATKSWQIWAIGGADLDSNSEVVDTVSILSIPSFQWFSAKAAIPRMSISCQHFGSQIFVMGGRTELTVTGGDDYESVAYIYDTNKQASVSTFSPSSTTYEAPSSVRTAISSASTPAKWVDPAVEALFMSSATDSPASSATTGPAASPSSNDSGGLSGGAIGGIVVGAILVIAAVAVLVWFLLRRRRNAQRPNMMADDPSKQPFVQEKAELDAGGAQGMGMGVRVELAGGHDSAKPVELSDDGFVKPKRQQSNPYELA